VSTSSSKKKKKVIGKAKSSQAKTKSKIKPTVSRRKTAKQQDALNQWLKNLFYLKERTLSGCS